MTCVHLRKLFQLCEDNDLKFSSGELVHIVCKQCQLEETCPSLLIDEYEAAQPHDDSEQAVHGESDSGNTAESE